MINTKLHIRGLKLPVNLGWPDKERQQEQIVLLDLEVTFNQPPLGSITDDLKDTVCYSALIKTVRDQLSVRNFHLIEYLSHEIYAIVKNYFPPDANLTVKITKYPNIEGLTEGVSFTYSDEKK